MVYLLKKEDYYKIDKLFNGWPFDKWYEVMNQKVKIYVDDPNMPTSAVGFFGRWVYCVGKPNKALITRKEKEWLIFFPQNKEWEKLIKLYYPDAYKFYRYAIKHDANFDRDKLQSYIDQLPDGYEIKKIDSKIYDLIKKSNNEVILELIDWFTKKKYFLEINLGYVVIKDGEIVGGASTAIRLPKSIDIEVDIDKKHRKKGLASAVCAKLILDCLDQGIKPTWDAANKVSVHLAEKLGYTFNYKYPCYLISSIIFKTLKNPDKSKWSTYCGKYETNCKNFKLKEVWMEDGDLYGLASNETKRNFKFKFYPIKDNVFGRLHGNAIITFGEDCYIVDNIVCKKL